MARGHVVARSRDVRFNVIGRSHMNSILDTRMYQVEFNWGKVAELTTNIIAKSLYAQFDSEGKKYLLLDALVDY